MVYNFDIRLNAKNFSCNQTDVPTQYQPPAANY